MRQSYAPKEAINHNTIVIALLFDYRINTYVNITLLMLVVELQNLGSVKQKSLK